ncbi:MAG: hypothetical protein H0W01_16440 [Pseudonocardiales bacterium]|nr:hypothetical protein [Pseudonocardiales bacterium]
MFVQVIQGQVSDPEQAHAALERWATEVAPGASGWLGSTAGVTGDGQFLAVARFDSEQAARTNQDRPEQDRWWAETSKLFDGEPTFHDSDDVVVDTQGDPDQAGFVQIMQGRGSDPDRARELMTDDSFDWAGFRPDMLGSVAAMYDAGAYTMVLYFTSEAEAREGEQKDPPPEVQAQMEEMNKLSVGETQFFDLRQPWIYAPK